MYFITSVISLAIDLYVLIIILEVVVHWLIIFEVFDAKNPKAAQLLSALHKATDPLLGRLKKHVPPVSGLDITPVVAILFLWVIRVLVFSILL